MHRNEGSLCSAENQVLHCDLKQFRLSALSVISLDSEILIQNLKKNIYM